MRHQKPLVLLSIAAAGTCAGIQACSKPKAANTALPTPIPSFLPGLIGDANAAVQTIGGTWSLCKSGGNAASASPGATAILGVKTEYVFQPPNQLDIVTTRYTQGGCAAGTEYDRNRLRASYALNGASNIVPGAINLDYVFQSEHVTAMSPALQYYNAARPYGMGPWQARAEVEVTGRQISSQSARTAVTPGTRFYTVTKVDPSSLVLGAISSANPATNGSSPELRHASLDVDAFRR